MSTVLSSADLTDHTNNAEDLSKYHLTPWIRECIEAPLIPQRSEQWFAMRKTRITGSMCDSLIGSNPFQSYDQLVCEKAGLEVAFKGNAATAWGVENEDKVIRMYEAHTGRKVFELGLTNHPTIDILAHSPDGISCARSTGDDGDVYIEPVLLEVKCPMTRKIKPGYVPKYYGSQARALHDTQHSMM
jgi:putative phage-type endonuclease